MAKSKKKTQADGEPNFEESLEKLEAIVNDLEEGQIGLSETLARYEEGIGLLKQCYQLLDRAEQRIALVAGLDAEGNPRTEPFDALASESLEEKAANRSERRTRRRKTGRSRDVSADEEATMDEAGGLF